MNFAFSRKAPLLIGLALAAFMAGAQAQDVAMYYKIGGARPVSGAASAGYNYRIGVDLFAGGGFSCGRFNLKDSVRQVLGTVKNAADEYQQAMVTAAQSAIASLPALLLQRMNPGLYDIFQNALLSAKADVNLAVASCQQMENDIANGKNPYEDWIRWGRWSTWQQSGTTQPSDAIGASETVRTEGGELGVPWICTSNGNYAGGKNQRPIQPIRDAVTAGYNILAGRVVYGSSSELCSTDAAPYNSQTSSPSQVGVRLGDTFATPKDAADFALQVLGDTDIYTYQGGPKQQTPGSGVLPYVERESVQVSTKLNSMITNPMQPSALDRKGVSAMNLQIDNKVIAALKNFNPNEREQLTTRLSYEIAVNRMLDKMLLTRRMLLSARDVAVVRNAPPAISAINDAIANLSTQIDELAFENRIRKEMVSSTAQSILEHEGSNRASDPSLPAGTDAVRMNKGSAWSAKPGDN